MKKCGTESIIDTYVQLAHAVNTMQSTKPLKPRYILEIIKRLADRNIPDWSSHKGIGVLLQVLKSTATYCKTEALYSMRLGEVVDAAKVVWKMSDPFHLNSQVSEYEKVKAITHYLYILSLSPRQDDWSSGALILPRLLAYRDSEIRLAAFRIIERLEDPSMAIQYWQHFSDLPFDSRACRAYMKALSRSGNHCREAIDALDLWISNAPKNSLPAKVYCLALSSCIRMPNPHYALQIYERLRKNPFVKADVQFHKYLLAVFISAAQSVYHTKIYSPDFLYSVIKEVDIPSLMRAPSIPRSDKEVLISKAFQLLHWRISVENDPKVRNQLEADKHFYKQWLRFLQLENDETTVEERKDETLKENSSRAPIPIEQRPRRPRSIRKQIPKPPLGSGKTFEIREKEGISLRSHRLTTTNA